MPPWFIAPMENTWFEVVMVIVKDKKNTIKRCNVNKISFMYYMKWTRILLPVVSKEFELVFAAIFLFSLSLSITKKSILAKIWGGCGTPLPPAF